MFNVHWLCWLNRSGYSQAAQDYIIALNKSGDVDISLSLFHKEISQLGMSRDRYVLFRSLKEKSPNDSSIPVFHCIPSMQKRFGHFRDKGVGFATFETTEPPLSWIDDLNRNICVFAPSNFCKDEFKNAGVSVPIHRIPHIVDDTLFHPNAYEGPENQRFTFLFFAAWKKRKGWDRLLRAWFRYFKKSDGVRLLIKTDNVPEALKCVSHIRIMENMPDPPPVHFATKVLDENELPKLMASADCLVSPSLGEGFCLPAIQAMACGTPVVCTKYAGVLDFANEDNSFLMVPEMIERSPAMDGIKQFCDKKWAFISEEQIATTMKKVIEDESSRKAKIEKALKTVKEYSPDAVSKLIKDVFRSNLAKIN